MNRLQGQHLGRLRLVAIIAGVAVAVGIGAAVASPPPPASIDAFDGRTWLTVQRELGPQLLLVNGISGLIEASADVEDVADPPRFVGAGSGHTLFRSGDTLIAVDDATHVTTTREVAAGDRAQLGGGRVLVVGERAALLPPTLSGEPSPLADAVAPVPGAPPVVDAQERAWYLGGAGGRSRFAVRVEPDGTTESVSVAPSTTRLAVVDGTVHAVGASVVPVVNDGTPRPVGSATGTMPSVAAATGGVWATAEGSTVTTRHRATDSDQPVDGDVTDLAVWHGSVVAVTTTGVVHGRPGSLEVIPEADPGASLHLDGGLLWVVTPETAIAIDPDQKRISIPISSADLSLCVGDCSAAAASSFLADVASTVPPPPQPTAGNESPTPTTAPTKKLEVASVAPTLPPTTVPRQSAPATTVATAPEPPPVVLQEEVTTTTQDVAPPPADRPSPPPDGPGGREKAPPKSDPPVLTTPTSAAVVTTPTTAEPQPEPQPEPKPEPEPAPEPEPPVGLEYDVEGAHLSATAYIRVLGRPTACGESGLTTTAQLSWTGSSTGSREVFVTWKSASASRSEQTDATITAEPGELTVTVTVCGVTASDTVTVTDPTPTTTIPPTTTTPTSTTTTTTPTSTTPTSTTAPPTSTTAPPTSTTAKPTTTTTKPTTTIEVTTTSKPVP